MFSQWYFGTELTTWALVLEIVVAGLMVVLAGTRFTQLGDLISDRLNLGGALVGVVLLATVTSLPEVATGVTATWIGNADLAFAGIFGSCSFNIILIVLLNALIGGGSILQHGSASHRLTSSLGLILMSLALILIVAVDGFAGSPRIAQTVEVVGALLIAITYVMAAWLTFRYERTQGDRAETVTGPRQALGTWVWIQLVVISAILIVSSWWLAKCGDVLSDHPIEWIGRPLGATFVGACFLAAATSLPEITTSIAAVRLGNLDLALGNIFGSNMFNIFVIPMLKLTSLGTGDALLLHGAGFHMRQALIAGLLPILLTAVAVGGLTYHTQRRIMGRFGVDSVILGVIYVAGVLMILSIHKG